VEPKPEYGDKLDAFAVVELFGHTRIAGRVFEFVIGGTSFVRVDVPEVEHTPAFTKLYGPAAIYSITFTDEETVRWAVAAVQPQPITIWLGMPRQPRPAVDYDEGTV